MTTDWVYAALPSDTAARARVARQAFDSILAARGFVVVEDPPEPGPPSAATPVDVESLVAAAAGGGGPLGAALRAALGLAKFTPGAVSLLTTPTYDGSGQATHPSVIDLGASPASGYRYWMAFTPYPGTDSTKENPSVVASNDLLTWVVPAGATNPLVPYPGAPFFNSDTHLIYWAAKFWLYYRTSGPGMSDRISVITSTDGITWTAPVVAFTPATSFSSVSPSFRVVGDRVLCWYVRSTGPTGYPNEIYQLESRDGLKFQNPRKCSVNLPDGATPWHIDVDYSTTDEGAPVFVLAAGAFTRGGGGSHASLYVATSGDGVVFDGGAAILEPSPGTWYDQGIYRPSLLRREDGYRVIFSGYRATGSASRIGWLDLDVQWPTPKRIVAPHDLLSERVLTEASVGASHLVGTTKMKGIAPTLILPKATSSVSTMWRAFSVPYGIDGTMVVDFDWLVEDVAAGMIRFRVYVAGVAIGTDTLGGSGAANGVSLVAAPGVLNVVQRTRAAFPRDQLLSKDLAQVRISRDGQDASDTYPGDVLLSGFRVRYGEALNE